MALDALLVWTLASSFAVMATVGGTLVRALQGSKVARDALDRLTRTALVLVAGNVLALLIATL